MSMHDCIIKDNLYTFTPEELCLSLLSNVCKLKMFIAAIVRNLSRSYCMSLCLVSGYFGIME